MAFTTLQRGQGRKDRVLACWALKVTEGRGSIEGEKLRQRLAWGWLGLLGDLKRLL